MGLVDPDREHVHGRAVPAEFDGHLWINSEFSNVDPSVGPDSALMFQILKKYAPKIAPQAFAQMGFMDGKFATHALLSIKGAITAKSYNAAVSAPEEPEDRHPLQAVLRRQAPVPHPEQHGHHRRLQEQQRRREGEAASQFAPVDKSIAQTRVWEKKFKLNTGK